MEQKLIFKLPKGFSLVELILTAIILSIAVGGSMTILGGMVRQSTDAERQSLAIEYARMRMEQILSKRFHESLTGYPVNCATIGGSLGAEAGESENTSPKYDDVDDFITGVGGFDGEVTAVGGGSPGDPLENRGLKTNVFVQYVTPNETGTNPANSWVVVGGPTCYKRVTVETVDAQTDEVLARVRTLVVPYR